MSKNQDFTKAKSLGEAAHRAMAAHGVPATPQNYAVWFSYVSGLQPELTGAIDAIIAAKEPFTDEVCADLHYRFFDTSRHYNLLQQTGADLDQAVEQVMKSISAAAGDHQTFNKTLKEYSHELGGSLSADRMRNIVANLLSETQRAAQKNRALEERLSRTSGEIAALQQNLEVVRRESLTDPLTGIHNRKFFDTRLREAARAAAENEEPLSLLILDIDHFKKFNDTYGHQLGDQVLRLVAKTLTECVKGRDTPARYGGEEFVIILPQTRLENAVMVGEQIRRTMVRHKIVRKDTGDDYGSITLSVGASTYRPGEALTALIGRADAALYHAKHTGRNRVVAEDDVPPNVIAEAEAAASAN